MTADETALLYYISRRLNSDLDINRVLADALDLTVQHVGASNGSIMIFDQAGTVAHKILARMGMPPEKAEAVIAEVLSQGLAGWVVRHQRGSVVNDVDADERWITFEDDDLVGGSAVGAPLLRRGTVIGVLTLRHPERGHFTDLHLALLSSIADQAAIAVQNAHLFHTVQAERAKMEAIINGAGDAILVTDRQGHMLLMNTTARRAFGVSQDQDVEQQYILNLIPNEALGELWEHRENDAYPSTGEISQRSGKTFYAALTSVPDIGYVVVMQDISDLKQLNEMKSDFVSAVSHDLRSPLQLIYTYAGMVPEVGPLTTQQKEFLEGINRGVVKMSDLIDNVLDLAKIEAGIDIERQVCHLDEVIGHVADRFQEIIHRQGLTLQRDIQPDLPTVRADASRIDQVLSNLIDNAIKYTHEGTITLKAFADESQVTVHVADTGIGLMPQELKGLFHKFYRAQNELTESVDGIGLGLAIAKSIVEQHGGEIWVQSTWQQGSTFAFSLPIDEQG